MMQDVQRIILPRKENNIININYANVRKVCVVVGSSLRKGSNIITFMNEIWLHFTLTLYHLQHFVNRLTRKIIVLREKFCDLRKEGFRKDLRSN